METIPKDNTSSLRNMRVPLCQLFMLLSACFCLVKVTFTLSKICETVWVNKLVVLSLVSQKNTPYLKIHFNFRITVVVWDRSFSTLAKFSEKLTVLTPWYGHACVSYQGVRNLSFSENLANVLNEWWLCISDNLKFREAILKL